MTFSLFAARPAKVVALRAAAFATLLIAAPAFAQTKPATPAPAADAVLAKVNGVEIRQSDLKVAEEEAGQLPPMSPEQKQDYLISFMSDMILVSKEAENRKIGDGADFKKKLAFDRNKLLMSGLLEQVGKAAVTEPEMRKVYDDAIKQQPAEEEVHARHILFRAPAGDEKASKEAEDKIKAVIERLKKGEDFAKVATELTEDPSGKANGGDLGYFTKEQMVPEFADVAFKLDKGAISDPVKTQFGWHVIKLEDKRTKQPPAFDEVKSQLETYVQRRAQAELVQKLRAAAKIERLDKPADAAKPAEPAKKK